MTEDSELDQIRLKKIQAMLDQANNQRLDNTEPMALTDVTFHKTVQSHDLFVVDFWAPWCGPCRMVGPIIKALSAQYAGKAAFAKLNVDENQTVPSSMRIMSIPTIVVFKQGKEVERLIGAYPKAHIEEIINRYIT